MAQFSSYQVPEPDLEVTRKRYQEIATAIDNAASADECVAAVKQWDELLCGLKEWASMTYIRFSQDTGNPDYKKAKQRMDELWPKFLTHETEIKNQLLESKFRPELEKHLTSQLFDLWQCDADSFAPEIEADLQEDSKLGSEYTELLGSAQIPFQDKTLTLSDIPTYSEDQDRSVREAVIRARSQWLTNHREKFDRIYDELVAKRNTMAKKLGYSSYTKMGYKNMHRIGYGEAEVATFRDEVREHVVPLAIELAKQQQQKIGVDEMTFWDLSFKNPNGNPNPLGDHDWMVKQAQKMFDDMGHGLDKFFREMVEMELIDLKTRKGKAPGGFCDFLHQFDRSFIFANFNGTQHDVDVFTHEMGHAFQSWSSRNQPHSDIVWPTTEACEIHSMGLEFLSWPYMELFYGEENADEVRKAHLSGSMSFLPYGVLVDHFQHEVYNQPDLTPDQRAEKWLELEALYIPWYNYKDLPAESSGRMWQKQAHIYTGPFYYIDYTLALTGALQFWLLSRKDRTEAMNRYVELCQKGGSLSYAELLQSVGFDSPFKKGCLKGIVDEAKAFLG